MEALELPGHIAVEDYVSVELLWKVALVIISAYWIRVLYALVNFFKMWFEEYITKPNMKYESLIARLENLNSKMEQIQTTNESQTEALVELKKKSDELQEVLVMLKMRLSTLPLNITAADSSKPPVPGGPPPPPPPPPPFSLLTPTVTIPPPSSVKTDIPKKKPEGPPQFSISQADITKVLQKLRKTNSAARLLGTSQSRKTPPRRKLFSRTPGLSRRRSITSLSPGGDLSRHKPPSSACTSPTALHQADENGNGCDFQR